MAIIYLVKALYKHFNQPPPSSTSSADASAGGNAKFKKNSPSSEEPAGFSGIDFNTPAGRNMFAVAYVGMIAAVDYTASLMSLQPMYSVLQGQTNLYGLALGIYDLSAICVVPMAAYYVDRTHDYFSVFLISMILSIFGNALYGSCIMLYFSSSEPNNAWKVIIISRAIMGMGSANLIIGASYITRHTSFKARLGVLGSYQVWQTVGRMIGPLVGFLFLWLPFPDQTSPGTNLIFNFYTSNGWLMVFLSLIGLCVVSYFFRNGNAGEVNESEPRYNVWAADKSLNSIFSKITINVVVVFVLTYCNFSLISQLFGFAAAQFKALDNQYDVWKPFVGLGIGAMSSALIWRRSSKVLRPYFPTQERGWAALGLLVSFALTFMFIDYSPEPQASPLVLMYAGTVLLGASNILSLTNFENIFSKQITQHADEVGSSVATLFSIYGITVALARFCGPFITAFVIPMTDFATGGGPPCETAGGMLNVTSTCCFRTTGFETSTCQVSNVNIYVPFLSALTFGVVCLGGSFLWKIVDYGADLNEGSGSVPDSGPDRVQHV